jgi:hypothetical protein
MTMTLFGDVFSGDVAEISPSEYIVAGESNSTILLFSFGGLSCVNYRSDWIIRFQAEHSMEKRCFSKRQWQAVLIVAMQLLMNEIGQ